MNLPINENRNNRIMDSVSLIVGVLAVCFFCLAYFVIGTDSYVEFHDQLDGEVINYIYQAKYLFSDLDIIPEFMNGMHKSSMTVPAPIGILFYLFLPPFYAFAVMHLFVLLVGYIGFYLLLKKITHKPIISMLISCVFIYLPFYSVYGLSILGQPLLVWALWQIYDSQRIKIQYLACVFLYACSSSLALIGYAWVGILLLCICVLYFKKKPYKGLLCSWLILVVTYVVTNIDLIKSILSMGTPSYVPHREEMVLYPISDAGAYFGEVFLKGVSYAFSYNAWITILAVLIICAYPLIKKCVLKGKVSAYYWGIVGLFSLNVLIALITTLWHMDAVISLRNAVGGFVRTFQLDRITWMLPISWYIILALCIMIFIQEIKWKMVAYVCTFLILLLVGNTVYENSMIFHNLRLIIFPETYVLMDWDDYYAPDVYQQIDDFIGKDKSTYRVVSLGLPPAAALYNGFYCLDGYSNFYSLEYKHEFRKIIAKELDKHDVVKQYYDEWGNRCYLFNAETGNYMMIDKNNNGMYEYLEFDTNQLKRMGGKYIFSGLKIKNATELGLELARKEAFLTENSYYKIWLYEIVDER